ncbi:hypothetical protein EYF80_023378 [Liparis tanakae]|uniref:Uncharacterized protein n=1 Tax=Liparis tanakae TaxID=230148 RepID=A0A4Z2HLN5_9TELE|nr:hypothetical protein EYF80_023378 [Liparis tanakae]
MTTHSVRSSRRADKDLPLRGPSRQLFLPVHIIRLQLQAAQERPEAILLQKNNNHTIAFTFAHCSAAQC